MPILPKRLQLLITNLLSKSKWRKVKTPPSTCTATNPPQIAPPLIRLPGELFSRIYEYVLTSDDDLLEHKISTFSSKSDDISDPIHTISFAASNIFLGHILQKNGVEFNRLKHTYKKFWFETKDLELKYNGVLFAADTVSLAIDRIESFLAIVSSQIHFLTKITISTGRNGLTLRNLLRSDLPKPGELRRLDRFCSTHPQITVRYILKYFGVVETSLDLQFLARLVGAFLHHCVRKKPLDLSPRDVYLDLFIFDFLDSGLAEPFSHGPPWYKHPT